MAEIFRPFFFMKIFFKILLVLIVLTVISLLSADYFIAKIIDKKVRAIQNEVKNNINFDYQALSFSFLQKRIRLKGFQLETLSDSLDYQDKVVLQVKKLLLEFEAFDEVLLEGKLHLKEVILKNPTINYGLAKKLNNKNGQSDSLNIVSADLPAEVEEPSAEKMIKSILIDEFRVDKGKAHIFHISNESEYLLDIKSINIKSKALEIDMDAEAIEKIAKSEVFALEMMGISSDEIKNHDLDVGKLSYNAKTNALEISDIHLRNKEKAKTFSAKQKYRSVWLDIQIDKLGMDVNPYHIYNKGLIYLKRIELDGVHAEIYNDVTLALKPDHQPMPPRMIREIPFPFKLDNIKIENSKLKYLHKDHANKPGLLTFNDIKINIANFTNVDYAIDQDPLMKIDIRAKLWGKGIFTNSIIIDLANPNDVVYSKGKLTKMSLKEAEKMLKPLYGVQISSGTLSLLTFDLVMNEDIGKGTMHFDYSDLKVDIKKGSKETSQEQDELKSNKLLNFIANEAVVNSNMPDSKHYIESGIMIYDRTKNKPIFDLFWNSIQVGIMDFTINDILYQSKSNYFKKERKKDKKEAKDQKKRDKK